MSFFTDPFKVISNEFEKLVKLWEGSTFGQGIDNAAAAAWTELKALEPGVLKVAAQAAAAAILPGVQTGGSVADIIDAGINAAEAAFKSAEVTVAKTTMSTFVSSIHHTVETSVATAAAA